MTTDKQKEVPEEVEKVTGARNIKADIFFLTLALLIGLAFGVYSYIQTGQW